MKEERCRYRSTRSTPPTCPSRVRPTPTARSSAAPGGWCSSAGSHRGRYLSDRRYREANSRIRAEVLGGHRPAVTIIITDIYDGEWLLEIEAIAAA